MNTRNWRNRIAATTATTAVALVVAVGLALGAAAPANAYQSYNRNHNGATDISGYAMVTGASTVYQPGVFMTRNGAADISQGQYVAVTYQLEIYTTAGWRVASQYTSNKVIRNYENSILMDGVNLSPSSAFGWSSNTSGSFRVSYLYSWGGPWSTAGNFTGQTGSVTVVMTAAQELQCRIATCRAYNGYASTWR